MGGRGAIAWGGGPSPSPPPTTSGYEILIRSSCKAILAELLVQVSISSSDMMYSILAGLMSIIMQIINM